MQHIDILIQAEKYIQDSLMYTESGLRGKRLAYYLLDVSLVLEKNKYVRGNAMYALEKVSKNFGDNDLVSDILLSAMNHVNFKIWMSKSKLSP